MVPVGRIRGPVGRVPSADVEAADPSHALGDSVAHEQGHGHGARHLGEGVQHLGVCRSGRVSRILIN